MLLLSIIDMVERGVITSNKIELSDELIATFKRVWEQYVGESDTFKPNITTPFWHMQSEPFWRLIAFDGREVTNKVFNGNQYSLENNRKQVAYAELATKLFDVLQNKNNRTSLESLLIETYNL